jgi:cation diffusion facilitator family transporter
VVVKLLVGIAIGSVSVISEGIHSGMDLLAAIIAFFAVRTSGQPEDEGHPFGHGKFENISGAAEALLIFVAAVWIIVEAIHKLMRPTEMESAPLGVAVMAASVGLNLFVSAKLFRVGRETDSMALQADAWHLRTDVWTSAGVLSGLGIIWIARRFFGVELPWLDPVAAIAVALLIVHAAWELTRESVRDLLDVGLPEGEIEWIREYLDGHEASHGYHHLRTRKGGATRFIEFHLFVPPSMSVEHSHMVVEAIEDDMCERFPRAQVTIHVEPAEEGRVSDRRRAPAPIEASRPE